MSDGARLFGRCVNGDETPEPLWHNLGRRILTNVFSPRDHSGRRAFARAVVLGMGA
ncbi:hypothetical protein IYX23_06110 [Methylocystis sp. L43]|uniref:hypothetical protein n=1 Tax=Methylocystis sp. L43 TaxID=2785790 RepID=UPI0018C29D8D|nr:hypothetical protein [Methylocystis sp. L43]MBG0797251.1 hypothetical protein [Methylocystis sp. L43]